MTTRREHRREKMNKVKARPGADLDQFTARIEEDHPKLAVPLTMLRQ